MPPARPGRRYPIGAEPLAAGEGTSFRVWAPTARRVDVLLESGAGGAHPLTAEAGNGYHSGTIATAAPGTRYRFRLDNDAARRFPDPASRYQPEGPHGPSEIVDPAAYRWRDAGWRGAVLPGAVLYELHVGTFTPAGTFAAATAELPALRDLGVTVVELMPIADFPGRFGWGYDGVDLFAPTRLYGRPDDLRAFVDEAHALGLGVILDVVYNHLGPDGNYLRAFSPHYFTDRYPNEWGEAINFDGPHSGPVRDFFLTNAAYWIDEFHLDGLRLDATQSMYDASPDPITAAITRRVREAARGRSTLVIAENEPQDARLLRPPGKGGFGLDAAWNDDFHHSARVAAVGRTEAYLSDYRGTPQELVSTTRWGYLYQGQYYAWQKRPRGTPALDIPPRRFVTYLQSHDQVANSGHCRLHQVTAHARARALTGWWLLGPGTPMIFQGQEFAASAPFDYFADHHPELMAKVRRGRSQFVAQFPSLATDDVQAALPDPADPATFARCKLDPEERARHAAWVTLHRDLLTLRRTDPVLSRQERPEGAVLGDASFALRFFGGGGGGSDDGSDDRLLLVNLGRDVQLRPLSEPLLAPPPRHSWRVAWTSEQPRYGGLGTPRLEDHGGWRIPPDCTLLLAPRATAGDAA
jgi:maltooligosyltrehalose trehalohydrolase